MHTEIQGNPRQSLPMTSRGNIEDKGDLRNCDNHNMLNEKGVTKFIQHAFFPN